MPFCHFFHLSSHPATSLQNILTPRPGGFVRWLSWSNKPPGPRAKVTHTPLQHLESCWGHPGSPRHFAPFPRNWPFRSTQITSLRVPAHLRLQVRVSLAIVNICATAQSQSLSNSCNGVERLCYPQIRRGTPPDKRPIGMGRTPNNTPLHVDGPFGHTGGQMCHPQPLAIALRGRLGLSK